MTITQTLQKIEAIRAARGYALPSHAILAAANSDLLEKYEQVYKEITYTFKALSPFQKNFVWLVVIGCAQTPTGAHHLKDFIDAHGTIAQVEAANSLAMIAIGSSMLAVIAPAWKKAVPDYSADHAYQRTVELIAAGAGLPAGLVEMAMAAGLACRGAFDKVALHIQGAKRAGISDDALLEALTIVILPAGNPAFVQACAIWCDLIRNGQTDASPVYLRAAEAI